jgi:hypothetical protein
LMEFSAQLKMLFAHYSIRQKRAQFLNPAGPAALDARPLFT